MSKPWNGKRAAVSLTFDDGLPVQISYALPELNRQGLPGTFFLIVNSPYDTEFRTQVWKDALAAGHEIGSHGMNHKKAAELNPQTAEEEVRGSKKWLEHWLTTTVTSFCYPYTDAPDLLQAAVRKHYKQARGGRLSRGDKNIGLRERDINLANVPAYHVGEGSFTDKDIWQWLDLAEKREAWITLMLHGVGPDETQWDNVPTEMFVELLQELKKRDIWVGTFGDVADYFRKQRGW